MTSAAPWNVRGVAPEVREAAKLAGRKAGMTVGAWVSQTILNAAAAELKHDAPPLRPNNLPHQLPPARYDACYDPHVPAARLPGPTFSQLHQAIQDLTVRVERAEARAAEEIAPLARKLNELSARIERGKGSGATTAAPIEAAMVKFMDRLHSIADAAARRRQSGGFFELFGRDEADPRVESKRWQKDRA